MFTYYPNRVSFIVTETRKEINVLLKPYPVSSNKFRFHKETNLFSAEASMLGGLNLGQVYDDSVDQGFTIVSSKTGKPAVFVLIHKQKDAEGDLLLWEFACVTPGLKYLTAVIYND